jgi:hypothetical protein
MKRFDCSGSSGGGFGLRGIGALYLSPSLPTNAVEMVKQGEKHIAVESRFYRWRDHRHEPIYLGRSTLGAAALNAVRIPKELAVTDVHDRLASRGHRHPVYHEALPVIGEAPGVLNLLGIPSKAIREGAPRKFFVDRHDLACQGGCVSKCAGDKSTRKPNADRLGLVFYEDLHFGMMSRASVRHNLYGYVFEPDRVNRVVGYGKRVAYELSV